MNKEDLNADIEMYFRQIVSLSELMLECNSGEIAPTILVIRDLAHSGLNKFVRLTDNA